MKQIALIDYTFMFDPVTTWQRGSQFERDLENFFAAHGYEAEVVETTGNTNRRILYISRIETIPTLVNNPTQANPLPSVGSSMAKLAPTNISKEAERFRKGRFLKGKGYLKRY